MRIFLLSIYLITVAGYGVAQTIEKIDSETYKETVTKNISDNLAKCEALDTKILAYKQEVTDLETIIADKQVEADKCYAQLNTIESAQEGEKVELP